MKKWKFGKLNSVYLNFDCNKGTFINDVTKGGGDVSPVKPQIHKERDSGRGLKFMYNTQICLAL